jgi:phosphoserine phosphatase RsbU/P
VHKTGLAAGVLTTLNRRLMIRGTPRRHAAVQYAVSDPRTREMQISSAGMPGPFLLSASGCRVLEIQGIPPGLFDPSVNYETLQIKLHWQLGTFLHEQVSDAFDTEGESFGIERLRAVCAAESHRAPQEFLGRIFSAVENFAHGRT